ncbi:MAG TPA: hypothetical protein VKB58_10740 [Terriglobales bacterium]|nr:hypothetical protein [Terriglobales bacterium]
MGFIASNWRRIPQMMLKAVSNILASWKRRLNDRWVDYSTLPQFAKYDVKEGWLLDVTEDGDSVIFAVEAACTWDHPRAGWTNILIVFPKVRSTHWIRREMRPTTDPDGTIDYGAIDSFNVNRDRSHLEGEWGEVEIVSDPIEVREVESLSES